MPSGRHADAVDARPADDRDTPAALRARAEDRERVVADDRAGRPLPRFERRGDLDLLGGKVDPGEEEDADLGDGRVRRQAGLAHRIGEQPLEHLQEPSTPR